MFWMLPLAGAALGALADEDKPLRGAAIGGGLGAGGAALGGGLLGGATAGSTASGLTAAPGIAGGTATSGLGAGGTLGEFSAGLSAYPVAPASEGLMSQASPYIKGANNVLGAASMAQRLAEGEPQQAAPSAGLGNSQQRAMLSQAGLTANQRRLRGILG